MNQHADTAYNPITQGSLIKEILKFSLPIFIGTILQTLYNLVDVVTLGQFVGKEAYSAVGGSTSTIINLLVGFFVGISSGATVLIAQKYGAGDEKGTSDAIHTAAAFCLAISLFLTVVGLLTSRISLLWLNTPEDILPYALTYIRIYYCGILFNLVYNIGSSILRALGNSKRPLYILMACSFSNIIIDLFFVVVLHMDTAGVALATVLSQALSATLVVIILVRTKGPFRLYFSKIRFHGYILRPMMRIGIPAGLQSSMFGIANLLVQYTVNGFGTDVVAAFTAYRNVDALHWMILNAFGISASTFVGQNLGAGNRDRVFKSVRISLLLALGGVVLLAVPALLFRFPVASIFTTDRNVIYIAADMMIHALPFYVFYVLIEVLSGAARGAGDSLAPMLITTIGICVVRVIWLTVAVPFTGDYNTIVECYPVTWVITGSVYFIYYRSRRWLRHFPEMK
ncbi:MAG: MATE family efflux transporter [Lachnospiraceae bacterium]|nr:MATE family efflux transporter [Lachnospiraceae bacterium]